MIDLHSHTTASDGSCSPAELVALAQRTGVRVLGITDHDTLDGYEHAMAHARDAGVQLVCGIELSTKLNGRRSVHLLGYFPAEANGRFEKFRAAILEMQAARQDRNVRLIARLQELGFNITLDEVRERGHGLIARPHFAQVMLQKGYVSTLQQAFDEYLDESAKGYVQRSEPAFSDGVQMIRNAGGIASLAHPVRLKEDVTSLMPALCDAGLNAIEAYHSDHSPADTNGYLELAKKYGLHVTGGSDFHGTAKPDIVLGTGRNGNLRVPNAAIESLTAAMAAAAT